MILQVEGVKSELDTLERRIRNSFVTGFQVKRKCQCLSCRKGFENTIEWIQHRLIPLEKWIHLINIELNITNVKSQLFVIISNVTIQTTIHTAFFPCINSYTSNRNYCNKIKYWDISADFWAKIPHKHNVTSSNLTKHHNCMSFTDSLSPITLS